MTARNDTANQIADILAKNDGYSFNNLGAAERLSYRAMADHILYLTEHKMAAQAECLSRALKDHWRLPA